MKRMVKECRQETSKWHWSSIEDIKSKLSAAPIFEKTEQDMKKTKEAKRLGDLELQVKKLALKEDDILLVHLTCNPKPGLATLVQQLRDLASVKGLKVSILVLPKEIELRNISEKEMNAEGWYKRGHRLVRPDV